MDEESKEGKYITKVVIYRTTPVTFPCKDISIFEWKKPFEKYRDLGWLV